MGVFVIRWQNFAPRWLMIMPVIWLAWQFIAGDAKRGWDINPSVLAHFVICLLCFYPGALGLNLGGTTVFLLWPLVIAFE